VVRLAAAFIHEYMINGDIMQKLQSSNNISYSCCLFVVISMRSEVFR